MKTGWVKTDSEKKRVLLTCARRTYIKELNPKNNILSFKKLNAQLLKRIFLREKIREDLFHYGFLIPSLNPFKECFC
jgi:hypothetical protein